LNKLNKIEILPYFPYNPKAKLRLEVLFKKFYPRINLTTFFLTKSYLLNTIKPFSGHENRSLTKFQKPSQGGYPKELELRNSEYAGHQVGSNEAGSQNFSSLGLMV
jgi:hypothetical protein